MTKKMYFLIVSFFTIFSLPLLAEQPDKTNQATSEQAQQLESKKQRQIKLMREIVALGKKIKAGQKTPTVIKPSPEFLSLVAKVHQQVQKQSSWKITVFKKSHGNLKQVNQMQVAYNFDAKTKEGSFKLTPLMKDKKQELPYDPHPLFAHVFKLFKENPKIIEKYLTAYPMAFKKDPRMPSIIQKWMIKPLIQFPKIKRASLSLNDKNQVSVLELTLQDGEIWYYDFNQSIKIESAQ